MAVEYDISVCRKLDILRQIQSREKDGWEVLLCVPITGDDSHVDLYFKRVTITTKINLSTFNESDQDKWRA